MPVRGLLLTYFMVRWSNTDRKGTHLDKGKRDDYYDDEDEEREREEEQEEQAENREQKV
jgi:hypothetical protein